MEKDKFVIRLQINPYTHGWDGYYSKNSTSVSCLPKPVHINKATWFTEKEASNLAHELNKGGIRCFPESIEDSKKRDTTFTR